MRSKGKVPSRVDLASFFNQKSFSAVHAVKPLSENPVKGVDPHDLDVSTRPDAFRKTQSREDITSRPRCETFCSLCVHFSYVGRPF